MITQLWKCELLREKKPNPSFVDANYNTEYSLEFFVGDTKITISNQTALVKNDPNWLRGMVSWTFISWQNLPVGAEDVVSVLVVGFSLPLKLTKIREPASSQKSWNAFLFNFTALLSAVPVPGSSDRGCIKRHLTVAVFKSGVERGKHFRTFPDKFFLKPKGVFAGIACCVSKHCCRLER